MRKKLSNSTISERFISGRFLKMRLHGHDAFWLFAAPMWCLNFWSSKMSFRFCTLGTCHMISRIPNDELQVRLNRWWFVVAGSNFFMIVSRLHGLVLCVRDANMNPGAQVVPWTNSGADDCLWYEDERFANIKSKLNDFCLEAQGNLHGTQYKKSIKTSRDNKQCNCRQENRSIQYKIMFVRTRSLSNAITCSI